MKKIRASVETFKGNGYNCRMYQTAEHDAYLVADVHAKIREWRAMVVAMSHAMCCASLATFSEDDCDCQILILHASMDQVLKRGG